MNRFEKDHIPNIKSYILKTIKQSGEFLIESMYYDAPLKTAVEELIALKEVILETKHSEMNRGGFLIKLTKRSALLEWLKN